ncbi:MAG: hypothetical protein IJ123_02395 [Blautia sp.]|nr:hypothetical protein [Blautia sp.]
MKAKRILSLLLSTAVITTSIPVAAAAESADDTTAGLTSEADISSSDEAEAASSNEADAAPESGSDSDSAPEAEASYTMDSSDRGRVTVKSHTLPCYLLYFNTEKDIPVYFADGVDEIPYISLADWKDIMKALHTDIFEEEGYGLEMEADGHIVTYTRENTYTAVFDFKEGTITFEDFDSFLKAPGNTNLLDTVASNQTIEDYKPALLRRLQIGSYDRYGKEIVLNLSDYDIPVYWSEEDSLYLLPLQTLGDFFTSLWMEINPFYNEKGIYLTKQGIFQMGGSLTDIGVAVFGTEEDKEKNKEERRKKYSDADLDSPNGPISEELAWYNYCELCLALDNLYGLKEQHGIDSFDEFFDEAGYRPNLTSIDPGRIDGALEDVIHYNLDDQHSGFRRMSPFTIAPLSYDNSGLSVLLDEKDQTRYRDARSAADHEIPPYEEVGNTAYITFDGFNMGHHADEYYSPDTEIEVQETPEDQSGDTVALIHYAHEQITREDSPIENVVLDLSLNNGGHIDAGAVVAAWFLGEAELDMMSSLTGAMSSGIYQLDANLDTSYDEDDTLGSRNLFCLTSPVTFSSANSVASILKQSHRVNLIGKTSGGGSCMILPLSTAIGTCITISSPINMASIKNGTYSIIDSGIEPDFTIAKPESFYNREALTEYINNLF